MAGSARKPLAKGLVGMLPAPVQAPAARFAYWARIGGFSPFGARLNLASAQGLPPELWKGNGEQGKRILNKRFTFAGCDISFSRQVSWFSREGSMDWLRALHGFRWIRDVAAFNDNRLGSQYIRDYITDWMEQEADRFAVAAEPDVRGERLASWLTHARYILRGASTAFTRRFLHMIVCEATLLRQEMRQGEQPYGLLAVKGLIGVALSMPQCEFLLKDAIRALHVVIQQRVLPEGASFSRNPQRIFQQLRTMIEIRHILAQMAGVEDKRLESAEAEVARWVEGLLHADGCFGLFNGSIEDDESVIHMVREKAMAHAERGAEPSEELLERLGYARLCAGKTVVMLDAGAPDYQQHETHYGTFSFELSHGFQRVVVNCGAYFGNDQAWSRVVKTTAAHSTLCVDDRNSCQFHKLLEADQEWLPTDQSPQVERRLTQRDGYQFFEGTYNGYLPYTGIYHRRQLLLNPDGTRLTGADQLLPVEGRAPTRPHDVNLRFHLHPSVKARRLMNGIVVLVGEDGVEWSFQSSVGQVVTLEESIYLGAHGRPQSAQQIVLYAPYQPEHEWTIEWSFICQQTV